MAQRVEQHTEAVRDAAGTAEPLKSLANFPILPAGYFSAEKTPPASGFKLVVCGSDPQSAAVTGPSAPASSDAAAGGGGGALSPHGLKRDRNGGPLPSPAAAVRRRRWSGSESAAGTSLQVVCELAGPCPVFRGLNRAAVPPKCDRHFLGYLQRKLWHLDICFGGNVVTYESAFWHGKDILARRCNFKFASCAKSGCGQSELFQMYGLDGYGFWTKTAAPNMQQIKFVENEE